MSLMVCSSFVIFLFQKFGSEVFIFSPEIQKIQNDPFQILIKHPRTTQKFLKQEEKCSIVKSSNSKAQFESVPQLTYPNKRSSISCQFFTVDSVFFFWLDSFSILCCRKREDIENPPVLDSLSSKRHKTQPTNQNQRKDEEKNQVNRETFTQNETFCPLRYTRNILKIFVHQVHSKKKQHNRK